MDKNMFYDKDFRNKIRRLDEDSLAQLMVDYAGDVHIKVLANTKDTFYFVIPSEASSDIELQSIQAANPFGKDGVYYTVGSVGSLGCASSTISGSSTAGTLNPNMPTL